jgi:outer membrane protein OmpA-like peptidoglycan-associated protein
MRSALPLVLVLAGTTVLQGCATDYPHQRTAAGATVGAITGAVVGHQLNHRNGAYYGAAIGALAGGAVGHYMDRQQQELRQSLEEERRRNQIQIQRMGDNSLKVTLDSEVSFAFDSAEIKPAFQPSLDKLAALLNKYNKTTVRIVGHTDAVGSDQYNQDLSERRAYAVADYLANRGVDPRRLTAEGRGKREPRASNATEAGRQLNRRVEIFVTPIVEGQQNDAYPAQGGYQGPSNQPQSPYQQGPAQRGGAYSGSGLYQHGPYDQGGPYQRQSPYQGPPQPGPDQGGPYDQGPYQGGPGQPGSDQEGPYDQGPYQGGPGQPGSDRGGPYDQGPYQGEPGQPGPDQGGPYDQGPYQQPAGSGVNPPPGQTYPGPYDRGPYDQPHQ